MILNLTSLYREELAFIESVKRRFPHVEVWLTQTDGRQASLAEAMRLGADGLLADDGMHRIAITPATESDGMRGNMGHGHDAMSDDNNAPSDQDISVGEPVLTADELRALLQEQPSFPPNGGGGLEFPYAACLRNQHHLECEAASGKSVKNS